MENSGSGGLDGEHGLSVLVESEAGTVLFDTGETDLFVTNAESMGVDLSATGAIVISHGHHDHAGGLAVACRRLPEVPVWIHPDAFHPKLSRRDGELHFAGIPNDAISSCRGRFRNAYGGVTPLPGMKLIAATKERYPLPAGNDTLFVRVDGNVVPDKFPDEISLAVEVGDTLLLVTGCSHRGIANIIEATEAAYPGRRIDTVIGGLHTRRDSPDMLAIVAEKLCGIRRVYAGHCTGEKAFAVLERHLGDAVRPCPSGTRITVPSG